MSMRTDETGAIRPTLRAAATDRRTPRERATEAAHEPAPGHAPAAARPTEPPAAAEPLTGLDAALAAAAAVRRLVHDMPGAAVQSQANIPPRNALGLLR